MTDSFGVRVPDTSWRPVGRPVPQAPYLVVPLSPRAGALWPPSSLAARAVAVHFGAALGLALGVGAPGAPGRHGFALASPECAAAAHAAPSSRGLGRQRLPAAVPSRVSVGLRLPVAVRRGVHAAQGGHASHLVAFWALAAVVVLVHAGWLLGSARLSALLPLREHGAAQTDLMDSPLISQ